MVGDKGDGAVARRQLARMVRELREKAGVTQKDAQDELGISQSVLYRYEHNRTPIKVTTARSMAELYKRPDLADALAELAKASKTESWYRKFNDVIPAGFDTYLGLEQSASSIRCYESELIPGILQTGEYARAIFAAAHPAESTEEIARRVQLRLQRQALLMRDNPPRWRVVFGEGVTLRPVGGRGVMHEQLERLLEVAELPNVDIHMVPFSAGEHPGVVTGPFVLLDFPVNGHDGQPSEPTTLYIEGSVGDLYSVEEGEVRSYINTFTEMIERAALGPKDTKTAITRAIKQME